MLHFVVPGEPVPWPRPKVVARQVGEQVIRRAVVPDKFLREREKIQQFARAAVRSSPDWPTPEPVVAGFCFVRSRPVKTEPAYRKCPAQRPDIDNLEKTLLDALREIIWQDDSQVVGWLPWPLHAKLYALDRRPRVEVLVLTEPEYWNDFYPTLLAPVQALEGVIGCDTNHCTTAYWYDQLKKLNAHLGGLFVQT